MRSSNITTERVTMAAGHFSVVIDTTVKPDSCYRHYVYVKENTTLCRCLGACIGVIQRYSEYKMSPSLPPAVPRDTVDAAVPASPDTQSGKKEYN